MNDHKKRYNQIAQIELISPEQRPQYYPHNLGTTSQKISLKARPIPAIIKNGKKITPNMHATPSNYDKISKENPNKPAKMQTRAMPAITNRSLKQKMKTIRAMNKIIRTSLRGALNIPARVSPQHSLQHWQSQQGS